MAAESAGNLASPATRIQAGYRAPKRQVSLSTVRECQAYRLRGQARTDPCIVSVRRARPIQTQTKRACFT